VKKRIWVRPGFDLGDLRVVRQRANHWATEPCVMTPAINDVYKASRAAPIFVWRYILASHSLKHKNNLIQIIALDWLDPIPYMCKIFPDFFMH